ncbi:hypothetical protein GCM10027443_00750 [Pontibacter brevis]
MKFSDQLKSKAIDSFQGELAWKKEDVAQAINELTDNGYAILGGDVWAVVKKQNNVFSLTSIDPENIAVGIIKGRDGKDYVFNWHSDRRSNEGWGDYVERSKNESMQIIDKMNAEETVAQELQDSIFYNLVFANEVEYRDLI